MVFQKSHCLRTDSSSRVFKSTHKNSKRQELSDDAANAALLEVADGGTRQWFEFQELSARLETLIAALPEKCRLVFKFSPDQGLNQKQIARELSISENTVKAHVANITDFSFNFSITYYPVMPI